MRKTLLPFILVFLAQNAIAATLTRPEAQSVIQKCPAFASTRDVDVMPNGFNQMLQEHMLSIGGPSAITLSPAMSRMFTGYWMTPGRATLQTPLSRVVASVTGIADGNSPSEREVKFTWYFKGLTAEVARCTGLTTGDHAGKAQLKHWDDGWRVESGEMGIGLELANGTTGSNTRPFAAGPKPSASATKKTLNDMCTFSMGMFAYWNSYEQTTMPILRNEFMADRTAGVKSADQLRVGLVPKYLKFVPVTDGYGHAYEYRVETGGVGLYMTSPGPDGVFGSDDDIVLYNGDFNKLPQGYSPDCSKYK